MKQALDQKIVIGGGGFAGVKTARELAGRGFTNITLISAEATFSYYPQLYHAATGGSHSESAMLLAELFHGSSVTVIQDPLTKLESKHKIVIGESSTEYHYDTLILALGNVTNYFGIRGLKDYSFGIKSLGEAMAFKHHLHQQLVEERKPDLHYVVIGAGPTGVELAGSLSGYLRHIIQSHGLHPAHINVELVEAADRILPRSPATVSRRVTRQLQRLNVDIRLNSKVLGETAETLEIQGRPIKTHTVIWTSGVANNPFYAANASSFKLDERGRVVVDEHLQAIPNVYVLGDNAATQYTGLAQTAIKDAKTVAANLGRQAAGHSPKPYHPVLPISVIPVGDHWAAVSYGAWRCYGRLGWMIRRIADLIGYSDIESLGAAWRVWRTDGRKEEDCPICHK